MRLTCVVMAFNEAEGIADVLRELHDEMNALDVDAELVIVDDGSSDETGAIAERFAALHPSHRVAVRVVRHAANGGLGAVYRTGFAEARGECLTFFPADGQFPALIIRDFLSRVERADLVLGYLPERASPAIAKVLSFAERVLYTLLFGPMPRFQGIMMIRREVLRSILLHSTGRGWAVLMELIIKVKRGGYRIVSAPTGIRPRAHGLSKVNNARTAWANLKQVVALRARV